MSEHTPGPWEVHGGIDYIHVYGGHYNNSDDPLAVTFTEANARLIAAAPHMKETLELISNTSELLAGALQKKFPKFAEGFSEMASTALKAVAKAEGK